MADRRESGRFQRQPTPAADCRTSSIAAQTTCTGHYCTRRTVRLLVPSHVRQLPAGARGLAHDLTGALFEVAFGVADFITFFVPSGDPQAPVAAMLAPWIPAMDGFQYVTWSQPQTGLNSSLCAVDAGADADLVARLDLLQCRSGGTRPSR